MKNKITGEIYRKLPLLIAITVLWIAIFIPLNSSMNLNSGHLIYTLDDTYIHMAIAKHFSKDGVFGVTKHNFTPSSSSPLWTLLLSFLFLVFGVSEFTPFIMNFFLASILIAVLSYFLEDRGFSQISKTLIFLLFIFFIPLPYLVLTGLEHILQILFSLILIFGVVNSIKTNDTDRFIITKPYIYITAFLLVSTRYEGLFLIGAIFLFLLIKKKFLNSLLLLISGLLPVIIYGIISISKGWYFIPNSILLKGRTFDPFSIKSIILFLYNGLRQVIYNIHILVLLIVVVFLLLIVIKTYKRIFSRYTLAGYMFIIVTTIHLLFAKTGFFLSINYQIRYDSYLLVLGLISILFMPLPELYQNIKKNRIEKVILFFLIFLILLPLSERGTKILYKTPMASSNTYSNQYMLGKFVDKYYRGESILLNDIGGINFLTDIKCLDILGLSSKEPADLILKKKLNTKEIEKLGNSFKARIAIVNDALLNLYGGVPTSWILVGQWKIKESVISPLDTISFYAIEANELKNLSNSLKEFSKTLPNTLFSRVLVKNK